MDETPPIPASDQVRAGLAQLQRYLGDEAAPMMVADSIQPLLSQPPELVIPVISDWITEQRRMEGPGLTVGDCLFHAVQRIFLLSQLQLIEKPVMTRYAQDLARVVLGLCPEEQRELLRQNLANLGRQPLTASQVLSRPGSGPAREEGAASREELRRQRRFSLLVDRLQQQGDEQILTQEQPADAAPSLRDRVVAASAVGARTEDEFKRYRQQLAETGLDARTEEVLRSLAQTMPGWILPEDARPGSGESQAPPDSALQAMRRIITGADQAEGSRRFTELVEAAIQRFNAGSLPQAHKMFRLAGELAGEGKVRPEVLGSLKARAAAALTQERLLQFAEDTGRRHLLRHILAFFPELQVPGLLADLPVAESRERRKLLLVLLEVHGAAARPAILAALRECVESPGSDPEGFFARNLAFLLRRIPREGDSEPESEVELLCHLLAPETPIFVTKEAVGVLGQIRHPRAGSALRRLLADLEEQMAAPEVAAPEDLVILLDRTISALARHGTAREVAAVLEHGTSPHPRIGTPVARLAELSATDLSRHPEVLSQLLATLDRTLPGRLLGLVGYKRRDQVLCLIKALSGTPAETVLRKLDAVAERFPEEAFGQLAGDTAQALRLRRDPKKVSVPGLAGDLDQFGLPELLQTLAGSERSGVLTLVDQDSMEMGVLEFAEGRIAAARAGRLEHREAVCQLFERPVAGSFTFRSGRGASPDPDSEGREPMAVIPLIMEAVRRHDELQHADLLVPDGAVLVATGTRPTRPDHESDAGFLRSLWRQVIGGATPAACEETLAVDSYRVRCAVAHWLEEGALQPQGA